jgi:hypothetical protein
LSAIAAPAGSFACSQRDRIIGRHQSLTTNQPDRRQSVAMTSDGGCARPFARNTFPTPSGWETGDNQSKNALRVAVPEVMVLRSTVTSACPRLDGLAMMALACDLLVLNDLLANALELFSGLGAIATACHLLLDLLNESVTMREPISPLFFWVFRTVLDG